MNIAPTTHTPAGAGEQRRSGSRPLINTAAPREYRTAQLAIDRIRLQLEQAEALLDRQLPAGHMGELVRGLETARDGLGQQLEQVQRWARARQYPVRTGNPAPSIHRQGDRVEIGGRN